MDSLREKLQNKWLLVASFSILLLLGICCYIALSHKPSCAELSKLNSADEVKLNFLHKLDDIISREYFAMIQRSYQMEISFYRNVCSDLSTADEHSNLLRDILQVYNEASQIIRSVDSKEKRSTILKIWRDQGIRNTKLSQLSTKDYDTLDFRKILEKNNFLRYKYVMGAELIETMENIREHWKNNVACIPTEYYREYTEFAAIDELFQKLNTSSNDKEKLYTISKVLLQIEQFSNEEMNFFPYCMEISKDILYNFFNFSPYIKQEVDY